MKNDKGFTIIELMVATFVGLIVATGLYTLLNKQMRFYNVQQQIGDAQSNSRWLMQRMAGDIIMTGYDPLNSNLQAIKLATNECLQYQSYLRTEGTPSKDIYADVKYCFKKNNNTVTRTEIITGVKQPNNIIVDNIANLTFSYYLRDGSVKAGTLADPLTPSDYINVRGVKIDMMLRTKDKDPEYNNNDYRTVQLSRIINPRNLGL